MLVIPGGGIEEGETQLEAVKREILEETGLDISNAVIEQLQYVSTGESEKTLKETNEVVLVKMEFYDFVVRLDQNSTDITLVFEDDFGDAEWYAANELQNLRVGSSTILTLQKLGFL